MKFRIPPIEQIPLGKVLLYIFGFAILLALAGPILFPPIQIYPYSSVGERSVREIKSAIILYYLEHERYPTENTPQPTSGDFILNLIEDKFIDPRMVSEAKLGFHEPTSTFYDPWGTPYQVSIDTSYSIDLTIPKRSLDPLSKSITVSSAGPDKDFTTREDNITTSG